MLHPRFRSLVLFACPLLFACRSTPAEPERPLVALDRFAVTYEGRVGPVAPMPEEATLEATAGVPRANDRPAAAIVEIQIQVLELSTAAFDRLLGPDQDPSTGWQGWVLSEADWEARLAAFQGDLQVLTAPTILCFQGQRAECSIVNEQAYIEQFELESNPGSMVADPKIATLQTGMHFVVQPMLEEPMLEEGVQGMRFEARHDDLLRMPTIETPFPAGSTMTLQVPMLLHEAMQGRFSLKPGEIAVLPPWVTPARTRVVTTVSLKPTPNRETKNPETKNR
ncbi:MAG TPA: hypothetical protein PLJ12_14210 [Planctomycetota bacterium]|nr:hypothetical protein [Planctomycetota bacterium]